MRCRCARLLVVVVLGAMCSITRVNAASTERAGNVFSDLLPVTGGVLTATYRDGQGTVQFGE